MDGVVDAISVTPTSVSVDTLPEVTVTWYANGGKFGEAESTTTKVVYGQAAVAPVSRPEAVTPLRVGMTLRITTRS